MRVLKVKIDKLGITQKVSWVFFWSRVNYFRFLIHQLLHTDIQAYRQTYKRTGIQK